MPNPDKLSRKQITYLNSRPVGRYAQKGSGGAVFVTPLCHVSSGAFVYISTERDAWKLCGLQSVDRVTYVVDEHYNARRMNRSVQVRDPVEMVKAVLSTNGPSACTQRNSRDSLG